MHRLISLSTSEQGGMVCSVFTVVIFPASLPLKPSFVIKAACQLISNHSSRATVACNVSHVTMTRQQMLTPTVVSRGDGVCACISWISLFSHCSVGSISSHFFPKSFSINQSIN